VRILGHRGASSDAPENTLVAFQLALDQGADGVELDARLCGSGEVVVFHDPRLVRLTGATGRVADLPWSALARLEVRAGPAGARPGRIPLLSEVLEALPRTAFINVELKSEDWTGTRVAEAAGALLESGRHQDHVVVSSFDSRCLFRLALAHPRLKRGLLLDPDRPQRVQRHLLLRWWAATPCTRGRSAHRGGRAPLARRGPRGRGLDGGRLRGGPEAPRLGRGHLHHQPPGSAPSGARALSSPLVLH
jgi:glycerophosphoryl diester phosphodiesterase